MRPEIVVGIATVVVYTITVVAIIVAPIIALKVQRQSDESREARNRKMWIFKTLMANRATRWDPLCVQALNVIDLEFAGAREKDIRDAWKELQEHYNDWGRKSPQQRERDSQNDLDKAQDLLAGLLVNMGKTLGYDLGAC